MGDRGLRNDSREVRWGILGAGHISHRFASSLKKVDGARLVAAAGRTPAHVEEFCRVFSIDAAHGHVSVSYTHLDVYKRQDIGGASRENLVVARGIFSKAQ